VTRFHRKVFLIPHDVGGEKSNDLVIIFHGKVDESLQIALEGCLSLVKFRRYAIFPQLSLGKILDLFQIILVHATPNLFVEC